METTYLPAPFSVGGVKLTKEQQLDYVNGHKVLLVGAVSVKKTCKHNIYVYKDKEGYPTTAVVPVHKVRVQSLKQKTNNKKTKLKL
jgi:hypothetical protein